MMGKELVWDATVLAHQPETIGVQFDAFPRAAKQQVSAPPQEAEQIVGQALGDTVPFGRVLVP